MGSEPPPGDDRGSLAAGEGVGPGSRVAGYVVLERVGRGGMAVVFRARDERLGRVVALKVLAAMLAEDEGFRLRFIRESWAAAAVDDPHIIPVYEAGEAGGVLFIAMRFVAGGDVRSLLRRTGPLPAARVVGIISPVAAALDAAHAAGLVHRDVKPANMLLDTRPGRPDHVYLSDFGLAKGALSSVGLTGTGLFLGTPDYISPEQIAGRPVDGRADQYSLACAAYEMLSGEPVFVRDHGMAVVYAHASEPPPAVTSRRPDLPAAADAALARALAKDPADRYGDCREFAETLRAALSLPSYDPGLAGGANARPASASSPLPARPRHGTGAARAASPGDPEAAGTDQIAGPIDAPVTPWPGDGTVTAGHLTGAHLPAGAAAAGPAWAVRSAAIGAPRREQPPAPPATAGRDYRDRPAEGRSRRPGRRAALILASAVIVTATIAAILATTSRQANPRITTSHKHVPHITTGRQPDPLIATLSDPSSTKVDSVAFSPDGKTIATGDGKGRTYLWDASGHTLIATLTDPPSGWSVVSVAFSPDGKTIATGDNNGSTYLWDASGHTLIATLTDPSSHGVYSVAFSPDGQTIAASDHNGSTEPSRRECMPSIAGRLARRG